MCSIGPAGLTGEAERAGLASWHAFSAQNHKLLHHSVGAESRSTGAAVASAQCRSHSNSYADRRARWALRALR